MSFLLYLTNIFFLVSCRLWSIILQMHQLNCLDPIQRNFDRIKAEKRFNLEEMCLHVAMEIRALGGSIKRATVQGFYERNVKKRDGHIHTLDDIGLWVDSKLNENLDNNRE